VLARISRSNRYRAGRIIALIYLFCVLAPSFAFAFGNARLSEHCLFDDGLVAGLTYQLDAGSSATSVHSSTHQNAGDHAMHHHHGAMQMADESIPAVPQHSHHHTTMDQQCCGMLCIAAMPVAVIEVATPRRPYAFMLPEAGRHLAGSAPARLYRPPIS
jgi:hypothetical protein